MSLSATSSTDVPGAAPDLRGRNFLKELDFTATEFLSLVELGGVLKVEKSLRRETPRLTRRNIALIFEKTSTRTRAAFEVAAHDQGAHVTYLGPGDSWGARSPWRTPPGCWAGCSTGSSTEASVRTGWRPSDLGPESRFGTGSPTMAPDADAG